MSTVDDVRELIFERLAQCEDTLDLLEKNGPALIRRLTSVYLAPIEVLPGVVDEVAEKLVSLLLRAIAYARTMIAFQRRMAEAMGSPDSLDAAAATIGTDVNTAAANLAPDMIAEALSALSPFAWSGEANFAYSAAFDGQDAAVKRIAEIGAALEQALTSMSDGIEQYYTALVQLVVSSLATILGLVVAIATWETIVGGVLGVLIALVGVVSSLVSLYQLTLTNNQTIDEILRGLTTEAVAWPDTKFAT